MKYLLSLSFLLCLHQISSAQKWIDTSYQIQQLGPISYGTATDFAGNVKTLNFDLCLPINDTPPTCGRPLLIAIHGGAFFAGNKSSDAPPRWMRDFAKRGYVTTSIDYRLGLFQTSAEVNCNITFLGIPWNCLNMADTAEWYRAAYRGIQDAKDAITYLINHASLYKIDPRNVYLVGESAGGFIAMGAAFLDMPNEKSVHCNQLSNVSPPHAIYENTCIQNYGLDTSISSMQFQRPDLGSIQGNQNPSPTPYTIKGVGNFYGGIFSDLFTQHSYTKAPALYLYHQPNDLVVPYDYAQFYQGAAYCFTQWPANCQWIINRPYIYGSKGIKKMLDNLSSTSLPIPSYYFDSTTNNADCLTQIGDPNTVGHSIDNYWMRTLHMAQFFAPTIDTTSLCAPNAVSNHLAQVPITIYPNPITESSLHLESSKTINSVSMMNLQGSLMPIQFNIKERSIDVSQLPQGIYILSITTTNGQSFYKVVK